MRAADNAERVLDVFRGGYPRGYPYSLAWLSDVGVVMAQARRLLLGEPRLLELASPVHCFGDIHGNVADLEFFSTTIWPLGIDLTAGSFLFLGDYVDRGLHSLEVVAYLSALKVLHPNKVFLLRGNHETRQMNSWTDHYGRRCLLGELTAKLGSERGATAWRAANALFDAMPFAAVIDGNVFCVHGGIPRRSETDMARRQDNRLDDILRLPCPARIDDRAQAEDAESCRLAGELLWNDPATTRDEAGLGPDGFGRSARGDDAVCYGNKALDDFLDRFNLSHIMRAHQPVAKGVAVSKSARVLTVFSTSKDHGCGEAATCGCLLVERDSIKAITKTVGAESPDQLTSEPGQISEAEAVAMSSTHGSRGLVRPILEPEQWFEVLAAPFFASARARGGTAAPAAFVEDGVASVDALHAVPHWAAWVQDRLARSRGHASAAELAPAGVTPAKSAHSEAGTLGPDASENSLSPDALSGVIAAAGPPAHGTSSPSASSDDEGFPDVPLSQPEARASRKRGRTPDSDPRKARCPRPSQDLPATPETAANASPDRVGTQETTSPDRADGGD